MCIQLREDLKEYPLKNSDFETPWRTLAKKKKGRLSERTQNGTISDLITLFDYANNNGMGIKGNPAKGLLKSKEDCKPVKVREEFTTVELNSMVTELTAVDRMDKPEGYWIPLLLLYTGMRSNEACQLRCADVADGFIHLRNNTQYNQRTKNAKNRQAPIHTHLLQLGFPAFCEAQRAAGHDRLFPALMLARGKWNIDYGKQFNRTFKQKFLQGYTKEKLSSKDLHSFRKTFIVWFCQSGLVNTITDITTLQSIIGHTDTEELKMMQMYVQKVKLTTDGYGGGLAIDPKAFIEHLDYGIDLSPLMII